MNRATSGLCFLILLLITQSGLAKSDSRFCGQAAQMARPGDVVFIQRKNPLNRMLSKITGLWATHPALILEKNKRLMVAESIGPKSKWTELCDFISQGEGQKFSIKRVRHLDVDSELSKNLTASAERKMGIPYDYTFRLSSEKQFCSKLVYQVYNETTGIVLGELKNFRTLFDDYRQNSRSAIWFLEVMIYFKNELAVPWDSLTISPASQYLDPQLDTIIEHAP